MAVAHGETKEKIEFASSAMNLDSQTLVTNRSDGDGSIQSRMDLEKEDMFVRHLCALFQKRCAIFKRDKRAWLCTTILPSLFVLIGFVVVNLVALKRNLDPVLLTLSDYNAGALTPRNPIVFNSPSSYYTCRPDLCPYQYPVMNSSLTNEVYYFCGFQARLDEAENCSITQSREIALRINDAGASPEETDVESIYEVRQQPYVRPSP